MDSLCCIQLLGTLLPSIKHKIIQQTHFWDFFSGSSKNNGIIRQLSKSESYHLWGKQGEW